MPSETERITVLIADDTDLMRLTIAGLLSRDPRIKVVAEAANYSQTLELALALQPDILLLDLHMPDECEHPPETVKNLILQNTSCVLAISIWNDKPAKLLAESLGAKVLIDKAKMARELIPTILLFCAAKCGAPNWSQLFEFQLNLLPAPYITYNDLDSALPISPDGQSPQQSFSVHSEPCRHRHLAAGRWNLRNDARRDTRSLLQRRFYAQPQSL